eukprot:CAMPEP_0172497590 /NCGR_PEP_ID=MMETSP1066-20121228/101957_1 /TAXON_ID=671091 /ORGANISM="Coscinodiscus wailesii, Strain CCMP2513" /LENGTH=43 /DNA_ID= /DNA_START= /DNA_END= /DNA_ORIENTATION=
MSWMLHTNIPATHISNLTGTNMPSIDITIPKTHENTEKHYANV